MWSIKGTDRPNTTVTTTTTTTTAAATATATTTTTTTKKKRVAKRKENQRINCEKPKRKLKCRISTRRRKFKTVICSSTRCGNAWWPCPWEMKIFLQLWRQKHNSAERKIGQERKWKKKLTKIKLSRKLLPKLNESMTIN